MIRIGHTMPSWDGGEVILAKKPELSPAAQRIDTSGLQLSWQHVRCLATDPIDMDHLFAVDPEITREVTALRLETDAQIHQTMAGASSQAAKLLKTRG
jgi:hypothetical protein